MDTPDKLANLKKPEANEVLLVAVGDAVWNRTISQETDDNITGLFEIIRTSDVAFFNLEQTLADTGYPRMKTVTRADTSIADEFKWAGMHVASLANNHTMDYGIPGMQATFDALAERDIRYSGVGPDLAHASKAACIERNGMKFAFLAFMAVPDDESWGQLAVENGPGVAGIRGYEVTLPDGRTSFSPLTADLEVLRESVEQAARETDCVVVSLHHHWGDLEEIDPGGKQLIARLAIDAGADIILGHGPHVLNGIEFYKGKPILYSIGNLFFQLHPSDYGFAPDDADLVRMLLAYDALYQNVIARLFVQADGSVRRLELLPVQLSEDGTPFLGSDDFSNGVIDRLINLSGPFGTRIDKENWYAVAEAG